MEEVRPLDIEDIRRANFDLGERVESEELSLDYNPEADVLTITVGEPRSAITEPLLDDILYRVDPDTLKIVGIEIVAFFSDFVRKNKLVRKLFKNYLEELHSGATGLIVTDPRDRELFGEVLIAIP